MPTTTSHKLTANDILTEAAFRKLRSTIDGPHPPKTTSMRLDDEYQQMPVQEIDHWQDGRPSETVTDVPALLPLSKSDHARLWVVTPEAVLHALKRCAYGLSRSRGELKHTNLTGGGEAFCGGELVILDENTVVVNGDSGRYGPEKDEMNSVLTAFAHSGYRTFTTGYDADAGTPLPLFGVRLVPVA